MNVLIVIALELFDIDIFLLELYLSLFVIVILLT